MLSEMSYSCFIAELRDSETSSSSLSSPFSSFIAEFNDSDISSSLFSSFSFSSTRSLANLFTSKKKSYINKKIYLSFNSCLVF